MYRDHYPQVIYVVAVTNIAVADSWSLEKKSLASKEQPVTHGNAGYADSYWPMIEDMVCAMYSAIDQRIDNKSIAFFRLL